MEWIVAGLLGALGLGFAALRSTWLIDYTVMVFVLNRGLRRVVDYYFNHDFNPLSPISLAPLVLAVIMTVRGVMEFHRLPPWASRVFLYLAAGVGYAFAIGFLRVRLGAVYALGEVLGPLALAGYALLVNPSLAVRDRWVRSFSWGAILASGYGWYQYLTIPPWDAFWLEKVGFVGYMGIPEPTKMTVFSTMAERGPLAVYLGFALVPMIVSSKWRTWLSWPGVILVLSVILLTAARGGLVIAVIATVIFWLVNRGAGKGQILLAVVVVGLAAWFGISRMPNSEKVIERLSTLNNLQEDGSFQGRMEIMSGGVGATLRSPLGFGLGAAGLGTRVNTGSSETTTTFGDAGYFQIVLIYGLFGTWLLVRGLSLAWGRLRLYNRFAPLRNDHVLLARALMIATLLSCWLGDMLTGFSLFWLALGCGLGVPPESMLKLRRQWLQKRARAAAKLPAGNVVTMIPLPR